MAIDRRAFCGSVIMGGFLSAAPARSGEAFEITDVTGRRVSLAARPKRIVLLEARDIVSMALVHPDPASFVAGWAATDRIDSNLLLRRFDPDQRIEVVGSQTPDTVSFEKLVDLSPDLVVANLLMAPDGGNDLLVRRLESAGIPVIFSDASSNARAGERSRRGPVANLHDEMRMWGELLDAREKAQAFARFFDEHIAGVAGRVADAAPVTTYLEVQSTVDDCCWAAGNRIWGELLELAGGTTLPGVAAPWFQKLSLEFLLTTPHDVYIASGGEWAAGGRPAIAPGLDPLAARKGLERLIRRTGFDTLPSVQGRRVHGIWTGLITVLPLNVLFVETAAKWLHPDRCRDLDPEATLAEINSRFLATPMEGPLWISL
ncbi:ABC transporter substrate-binding protein [Pseudochelatococcus sp. B33]